MKYLIILCFFLFSCAKPIPLVSFDENDECDITCSSDSRCVNIFEENYCVFDRIPSGFCDDECIGYQECRYGDCVSPDMNGTLCEFDSACLPNELCISARCTEILLCNPGDTISCYSGNPITMDVGECKHGYRLCDTDGIFSEECIGEVTPQPEVGLLRCNGRDDDCDGYQEEFREEDYDIVFAFDISISMEAEFDTVADAILEVATLFNSPSIRLGLILFPGDNLNDIIPLIPFTDSNGFVNSIMTNISTISSSTNRFEQSWDIPYVLFHEGLYEFQFRRNAQKVLIMFTDEQGQSYLSPQLNESQMCDVIVNNDVKFYTVVDFFYTSDFDDCSTTYHINNNKDVIVSQLSNIINSVCR